MDQLNLTAVDLEAIIKPMVDAAVRRKFEEEQSLDQPQMPVGEAAAILVALSSHTPQSAPRAVDALPVNSDVDPNPTPLSGAHSHIPSPGAVAASVSSTAGPDATVALPAVASNPPLRSVLKRSYVKAAVAPRELPPSALPENTNIVLSFSNRNDAVKAVQHSAATWSCPNPDPTIPTSDEERQEYVRGLLAAMMNREGCGNIGRKGKRWQVDMNHYSEEAMEKVCWDILDLAERLHTTGPSCLSIYDPAIQDTIDKEGMLTFAERIDYIIELLALYKSRCEDLLKGSALGETVATPQFKLRCAAQNKQNNKFKAGLILRGRGVTPGDNVLPNPDIQDGTAPVAPVNVEGNSEVEGNITDKKETPDLGAEDGYGNSVAEDQDKEDEDPCANGSIPRLSEDDTKLQSSMGASKHGRGTTSNYSAAADVTEPEAKRSRME